MKMRCYTVSSMLLFLLLLVFSLHMDEAFGAQTEIRKLKATTIPMRRNLKGTGGGGPSKIKATPSRSTSAGSKTAEQQPRQHQPVPQIVGYVTASGHYTAPPSRSTSARSKPKQQPTQNQPVPEITGGYVFPDGYVPAPPSRSKAKQYHG